MAFIRTFLQFVIWRMMVRAKFDCVFQIIRVTFIVYSLSLSFTEAFMWCEVTPSIFFPIATHSCWRQRVVFHRFSRSYSLVNLIYHITYAIFILTYRTFSFMLRSSCLLSRSIFHHPFERVTNWYGSATILNFVDFLKIYFDACRSDILLMHFKHRMI